MQRLIGGCKGLVSSVPGIETASTQNQLQRVFWFIAIILFGCLLSERADAYRLILVDPAFSDFAQAYPLNPDPAAALQQLETLDVAGMLARAKQQDIPKTRALLVALFIHVVNDAPPSTVKASGTNIMRAEDGERMAVFADAVSYSKRADRRQMIDDIPFPDPWRAQLAVRNSANYPDMKIIIGLHLDMHWAAFYGSKNYLYIQKLIAVLGPLRSDEEIDAYILKLVPRIKAGDDDAKNLMNQALNSYATVRAFISNAKANPELRAYLLDYLAKPKEKNQKNSDTEAALGMILALSK